MLAGLKDVPVEVQVRRAVQTLRSSARPLPGIEAVTASMPADWFDLLSRLSLVLRDDPAILIFDEFPWAVLANGGLDGLVQSLWDGDLSRNPVLTLLIGSDDAMMNQLFAHDRPLFGRLDDQLVVRPFNPAETALALGGSANPLEVFDASLITGGFPELIAHARRFGSTRTMVEDALSRPHSLLADMAAINLAGELADSASARLVLEAIGADEVGVVNFSAITATLGGGKAAETAVVRAMDTLSGVKQIVAIDYPAGKPTSRLKRYRITDPYLRFWFRFIEPQLRNMEVRSDIAIRAFHDGWTGWRGKAIEPLVRESVLRLAPRIGGQLEPIESVNAWWDRTGSREWDAVGTDHGNLPVIVGSVKWLENTPFDGHDLSGLAAARSVIPHAEQAALVAIAPQGVRPGTPADVVLTASDLLSAWQA